MKRGLIWFVIGIAMVWGAFRWWTGSFSPSSGKGSAYLGSVETARQDHKDHIASVMWRQSTAMNDSVSLTVDNQSGMDVYVKVASLDIDNAEMAVNILADGKVNIECPLGRFLLKMRYKGEQGYIYQKGNEFSLDKGIKAELKLYRGPGIGYQTSSMEPSEF